MHKAIAVFGIHVNLKIYRRLSYEGAYMYMSKCYVRTDIKELVCIANDV